MLEEDLFAIVDEALKPLGSILDDGEEFREPPLDILRFYHRSVRLHWVPLLGRASSVVAVARQPVDLSFSAEGCRQLLRRLAMATNSRYPPWRHPRSGVSIGLTALILTPEPIGPEDDSTLKSVCTNLPRVRAVPLGVIRVNLGQEAMSFALSRGPADLFPEPATLADALIPHLRRFVPMLDEEGA
ncbi:MAG TPA: hypothetical protein VGZ22_11150 [Isosphaeraceae bacterium]|jgi:hypothetical protein|nr:hypothetical protein [Isosphaeraceae bacterium]